MIYQIKISIPNGILPNMEVAKYGSQNMVVLSKEAWPILFEVSIVTVGIDEKLNDLVGKVILLLLEENRRNGKMKNRILTSK